MKKFNYDYYTRTTQLDEEEMMQIASYEDDMSYNSKCKSKRAKRFAEKQRRH